MGNACVCSTKAGQKTPCFSITQRPSSTPALPCAGGQGLGPATPRLCRLVPSRPQPPSAAGAGRRTRHSLANRLLISDLLPCEFGTVFYKRLLRQLDLMQITQWTIYSSNFNPFSFFNYPLIEFDCSGCTWPILFSERFMRFLLRRAAHSQFTWTANDLRHAAAQNTTSEYFCSRPGMELSQWTEQNSDVTKAWQRCFEALGRKRNSPRKDHMPEKQIYVLNFIK